MKPAMQFFSPMVGTLRVACPEQVEGRHPT